MPHAIQLAQGAAERFDAAESLDVKHLRITHRHDHRVGVAELLLHPFEYRSITIILRQQARHGGVDLQAGIFMARRDDDAQTQQQHQQ